ncbi:hypothetical protein O181_018000 [Austropuccinia psidii MF-1]|uniref:Integrase catalytic domain-containing protein n=1 Tax=Austropuccinia psidii MF-1 TaxID=1389203 RepID=A0A9Q3GTK7_9BASI|nr:hypothetical protein [Austropuccinia psidii MF-1]
MIQFLKDSITIEKLPEERFQMIINHDTTITGQVIRGLMSIVHTEPEAFISTGDIWHPSNQAIKMLSLPPSSSMCETCMMGKLTLLPFSSSFEMVYQPLECVHIDLVGPITPQSRSGYCYFMTIVDQFTAFKFVEFLKTKDEAFKEFLEWKIYAENFHYLKIKKLVSDRGGEFENKNFSELAASCGFIHLFAPTSTPEHNGFSEHANRTILNKARCLLLTSKLPRSYWAEAVNTASFLSNLMPTPSTDNLSPFLACFPSLAAKPDIHDCSRWVDINQEKDEAFFNCEDIKPEHTNDTSEFYHLDSSPSVEQAPQISENLNPCHPKNHCRINVIGPQHPTLIQGDIDSKNILPYSRRPKDFVVSGATDPISYSNSISGRKSSFWLDAIHQELNAMQKLEVCDVIPLEKDFKLVGTTWVFRQKHNELNEVIEYKARLCAKDFSQTFGQDYSKTFAPTSRLHSL